MVDEEIVPVAAIVGYLPHRRRDIFGLLAGVREDYRFLALDAVIYILISGIDLDPAG